MSASRRFPVCVLLFSLATTACASDAVIENEVEAAAGEEEVGSDPAAVVAGAATARDDTTQQAPEPIEGLVPGRWLVLGKNTIRDVLPDPLPAGLTLAGITRAWNGGAYDSRRGRLLVMGGGHADYAGNEIYAFDVRERRWSRLTDPTAEPVSVHNYDQIEYLPGVDKLFLAGGSVYPSGRPTNATWLYDFSDSAWTRAPDIPGKRYQIFDFNMLTAYDPVSQRLLMIGFAAAADFDPLTRRWRMHGKLPRRQLGHNAEIDPLKRVIVSLGLGTAYIFTVDKSGRVLGRAALDSSGDTEIESADAPGLAFDSRRGRLTAWASGSDYYTLDSDSRRWTRRSLTGQDPGDPYLRRSKGTFGRFRYMPEFDAFVVVTGIDEQVYVFRPND